jgi:Protein of unknown function (DUF3987)
MIIRTDELHRAAKSCVELVDENQVAEAVRAFADPAQSFELRSFPDGGEARGLRRKGDDVRGIVEDGRTLASKGGSVYFCVNPSPLSLARSACTKDIDVTRRRWFFLDIDPVRAPGFESDPASQAEVNAAHELGREVVEYLQDEGWPAPDSTVDSGGGIPLYWASDLPNDDEAKEAITALLARLGRKFDGPRGTIDPRIRNASRVMKLPGTLAVKGKESPGRTYRRCQFIQLPRGRRELVALEQIRSACPEECPPPPLAARKVDRATRTAQGDDTNGYYQRALCDECSAVASAPAGGRNDQLNKSACKLGHYVPAHLSEEEVMSALLDSARDSGLPVREAVATIRSGMRKGASEPKDKPPSRFERRGETNRKDSGVHDEGPPPWPDIVLLSSTPKADPFPLDVLPDPLQDAIREIAAALNVAPDFAAVPLLILAGASIGMSRQLEIVEGHIQHPLLYAALIAPPGTKKSPALAILRRPLDAIEREYHLEWKALMKDYKAKMIEYNAALRGKGKERPTPIEPERPILQRVVTGNATIESIGKILSENPRGIVAIRDELSAWISEMDQYKPGKGADRSAYLSINSCQRIIIDRKGTHDDGPLSIDRPFVSIVGNMTPSSLPMIRGTAGDDGFMDRIVVSYPASLPHRGATRQGVSASATDALDRAYRRLHTLEMIEETRQGSEEVIGWRPRTVFLTEDGWDAWKAFTDELADEMNGDDFPLPMRGPWAKLEGYCGRIALMLHYLRWACDDVPEGDVDGDTMRAAARLVAYFKSHARKAYHDMDCDPDTENAAKIVKWIETKSLTIFTQRDAQRGPLQRKKLPEVEAAQKILCDHGYIRAMPAPAPTGNKPGSPSFEVNPACHEERSARP